MRRIALVAVVLAGLAGSGAAAPAPAQAACAFLVVWQDRAYADFDGGPLQMSGGGRALDGAVQPGCNDTAGADEHPTRVNAKTIPGVSPAVWIWAEGHSLLGFGYLGEDGRDETGGCELGGAVQIVGRAHPGWGLVSVSIDRSTVRLHHLSSGMAQIFPDGHTRFEGLSRNGFPYIGQGQHVRVDARFCKVPGSIGTKLVARRITPAGPIVPPSTAEDVLGANWRGSPGLASRATGGHRWAVPVAIVLAAAVGALLLARRRSRSSGTG